MNKSTQWSQRIAAWRASGQTAEEYARGRGYSPHTLRWWSSRFRRELSAASVPDAAPSSVPMARVVRTAEVVHRTPMIVVELGGARVCVQGDASPRALSAVFEALRSGAVS